MLAYPRPRRHFLRRTDRLALLIPILLFSLSLTLQNGCSSSSDPDQPEVKTDPYGTISLWAGKPGFPAFDGDDNKLLDSWFYQPQDIVFTTTGCYILDWNNHRVRHLTAQNTLQTVVGTNSFGDGDPDLLDRVQPVPATTIRLNHPTGVTELPNGNLLVSCWHNHKLREYDPNTGMAWVVVGQAAGFQDGPVADALMNFPVQTVVASDGTVYMIDQRNQRVRKLASGQLTTFAGNGTQGYGGDGGPATGCMLNFPTGNNPWVAGALAIDGSDRVYITDTDNHRIRRVDPQTGIIETIAGNGSPGYSGDWGDAMQASLSYPRDIEFGPDNRLYIADEENHVIRAVDLTTGIITTVAGTGSPGYSGEGGSSTGARLNRPGGIGFDSTGAMYIADTFNHVIRKVTP